MAQTQFQKGAAWAKRQVKAAIGKRKNGGKRFTPGILGRTGAFLVGAGPPALAGVGAAAKTVSWLQSKGPKTIDAPSSILAGVYTFMNNLTVGLGGEPIVKNIDITLKDGSTHKDFNLGQHANVPRGSTWALWGTGISYMFMDRVANFLNGGKGQKLPKTRVQLIGSGS